MAHSWLCYLLYTTRSPCVSIRLQHSQINEHGSLLELGLWRTVGFAISSIQLVCLVLATGYNTLRSTKTVHCSGLDCGAQLALLSPLFLHFAFRKLHFAFTSCISQVKDSAQSDLIDMSDTSARYLATSAHCVELVELVRSGDIAVADGIDQLIELRRSGTPEQKKNAVGALQTLACNPDVSIACAARRVLHERFVDDAWRLFIQYREAMTQTRREHDDIITAVLHNLVAVEETATQQSLEQAEINTDQTEAADAD